MTTTAQAAAAGPSGDGIDHGTVKGYRQHRARNVPYCEPCRTAIREENRAYQQRRRASDAQLTWNRGRVGKPEETPTRPIGRDCSVSGCGSLATEQQPAARMVRIEEPNSREPGRWYCVEGCAAYGQALAEIRTIPLPVSALP